MYLWYTHLAGSSLASLAIKGGKLVRLRGDWSIWKGCMIWEARGLLESYDSSVNDLYQAFQALLAFNPLVAWLLTYSDLKRTLYTPRIICGFWGLAPKPGSLKLQDVPSKFTMVQPIKGSGCRHELLSKIVQWSCFLSAFVLLLKGW
jgi:hypothetical protein